MSASITTELREAQPPSRVQCIGGVWAWRCRPCALLVFVDGDQDQAEQNMRDHDAAEHPAG